MASPALGDRASYVACRHSTDVNAWVTVLAKAGPEETMAYSDTVMKKEAGIRLQIPIFSQKQLDLRKVEVRKP